MGRGIIIIKFPVYRKAPCSEELSTFRPLKRFQKLLQIASLTKSSNADERWCLLSPVEAAHPLFSAPQLVTAPIDKWRDQWKAAEQEEEGESESGKKGLGMNGNSSLEQPSSEGGGGE